ncbi:GPO family capsid scaffolding protein [Marinobacter sp. NFXS9]|uniref:GPO family capsid scaffolding protein n=1 Tax=Marinobacter sp. NFXS9 TaxID=2818433 RepID=UPI0032DFA2E6
MKKWFRVATEGATTDGRAISRAWIEQMAANFDPAKYGARVWLEHMRGMLADGPFKALGDVHGLRAEENADGKMELHAQIEPTKDLIAMNKDRQKIYTSIEVDPEFSDTGEAYLVGLAVTDSPASLGTEMLQFSSQATHNPLSDRKQRPENLFSAAMEAEFDFTEDGGDQPGSDEPSLFNKVKALFSKHRDANAAKFADFRTDLEKTLELFVGETQKLQGELESRDASFNQLKLDHDALQQKFDALSAELENSPHHHSQRPPATGGDASNLTDC